MPTQARSRLNLSKGKEGGTSVTYILALLPAGAAARNWRVAAPLGGEVVKRCFALGEARHAPPGTAGARGAAAQERPRSIWPTPT